jgi:hypothetical protein
MCLFEASVERGRRRRISEGVGVKGTGRVVVRMSVRSMIVGAGDERKEDR